MNFKDYAHLYIGCRCFNTWFPEGHKMYDRGWQLKAIDTYSDNPYGLYGLNCYAEFTWTDSIKPILRLVEDMTDDDIKLFIDYERLTRLYQDVTFSKFMGVITVDYSVYTGDEGVYPQSYSIHFQRLDSLQFHHLIKEGFDMFSLIKNGLAIDLKTIK